MISSALKMPPCILGFDTLSEFQSIISVMYVIYFGSSCCKPVANALLSFKMFIHVAHKSFDKIPTLPSSLKYPLWRAILFKIPPRYNFPVHSSSQQAAHQRVWLEVC